MAFGPDGASRAHDGEVPDSTMSELIDLASPVAGNLSLLSTIPGGYPNSCPEVDAIVDLCKEVDGVHGACLTGAGFGGYAVALVREDAVKSLFETMRRKYYERRGISFGAAACHPVRGAVLYQMA